MARKYRLLTSLNKHNARDLEDMRKLAHIEGQVRGLKVMVEGDQPTAEMLFRLRAVVDALREVALSRAGQEIGDRVDALLSPNAPAGDIAELQSLRETLIDGLRLSRPSEG